MYEIDNEKFGAFLSRLRKEKGMTQKELAERLFISDKAVSKWERGLSLPDISLLQPIADIFEVSITELLSGQYIRKDEPITLQDIDPLLTGALQMSAQEKAGAARNRRYWGKAYLLCLGIAALSLWLIRKTGYLGDNYACMLWLPPAMAACFGIYFIFLAKEKLPAFYDQNRLSFYSDGIFRMNLPGVCFNNRNWPHILLAARGWCCAAMAGWTACYTALRRLLSLFPLPERAAFLLLLFSALAAILAGLFLPVIVAGRKYQ
ncbi:MAG: helix-turn-helix transcriptional regulator [Provencibacterium sp.]|jgi:transcriptional regulator with XRE-family HTH domain|nr:helix-turn-helix transcriptional regulator [Provencibacterium sp.]